MIGDFGCAQWIASGEKAIRGSPMYMAPEAARGQEQGMPADIWAFGCTVIEMITGRPPWPDAADSAGGIHKNCFSGVAPAIPAWFSDDAKDFLVNCFWMEPEGRWTAEQLLRHPFVESSCSVSNPANFTWVSPKSILDLCLWESMEKDEEREEEEFLKESAVSKLQELAAASSCPNWSWDEQWINTRNVSGKCTEEAATVAGGEVVLGEFLTVAEGESTNSGVESIFSTDDCHLQEGDYEMICSSCKFKIIEFCNDKYKNCLRFLIGSLVEIKLALCCFSRYYFSIVYTSQS